MKKKPETIENRWDILYRDYPKVYDKFTKIPRKPEGMDVIKEMFNIKGKIIADIGSGSGKSTFPLVKSAKFVYGIEPEDSMRKLAIEFARKKKIKNVEFKKGWAQKIPLKKNSVDFVFGITIAIFYDENKIRKFVKESKRILKKGGYIVTLNIAPKWYGGELAPVILGKSRKTKVDTEGVTERTMSRLGFIVEQQINGNIL